MDYNDIDEMEQVAKYKIITMDEGIDHSKYRKILQDLNDEITRLYKEFKIWMEECMDSETMNPHIEKLKSDTETLIRKAKKKLRELREDEEFQAKLTHGKEVVVEHTIKVVDYVSDGVQEVLQQETVKKAVNNVSDAYHQFKNDERVKQGVKKFKKGSLKVAESAFEGLKKVLEDTTDEGKR